MSNWITHDGGPMPVSPDTVVEVKFEWGDISKRPRQAGEWAWPGGITEYRIIEEPKRETEIQASENTDLRDRYAMAALTGLLSAMRSWDEVGIDVPELCNRTLQIADAMIVERGKK